MSTTLEITEVEPLILRFGPVFKRMTDDEFYEFCRLNEEWRIELSSEGDLIIMAPTGSKSGIRNFKLIARFAAWVEADGTGQGFDSSTMFTLPNGAKRSPDMAWIKNERWQLLNEEQQEKFAPICPDFVVELRSKTDRLATLQKKMREYMENGAQLGWLIDPREKKVYVYRPDSRTECLNNPQAVSGEPLLAGFVLNVSEFWD